MRVETRNRLFLLFGLICDLAWCMTWIMFWELTAIPCVQFFLCCIRFQFHQACSQNYNTFLIKVKVKNLVLNITCRKTGQAQFWDYYPEKWFAHVLHLLALCTFCELLRVMDESQPDLQDFFFSGNIVMFILEDRCGIIFVQNFYRFK